MAHEEVLKSFYATLKGVSTHSLTRVVDLAKEHHISYRALVEQLRASGIAPYWINGKAFVHRQDAIDVLYAS